jgi:hypothetical protein
MAALRSLIARKLGRCPVCIRLSLRLALAGWAAWGAAIALHLPWLARACALGWATAMTGLWIAHLAAFGARAILIPSRVPASSTAPGLPPMPRRHALAAFLRAAALMALASTSPALLSACSSGARTTPPSGSGSQSAPSCGSCPNPGWLSCGMIGSQCICCPPGYPYYCGGQCYPSTYAAQYYGCTSITTCH